MEGFEWVERIPKYLRWILFIPAFFVTLILMAMIIKFNLNWFVGSENQNLSTYLIHRFSLIFGVVACSIIVSCLMIPKGKLILASIYLGLIVLYIGFIIAIVVVYGLVGPLWKTIYEGILVLSAGIFALLLVKNQI